MTPRVVFGRAARSEVREAREWYEEQLPGLGREFARAIDAAVEAIAARPEAFPQIYGEFRQCVLRRFPYTIFFRPRGNHLIIVAVHHERRDPMNWQSRTA